MCTWTKHWKPIDGHYFGYVDESLGNIDEILIKIVDDYCLETGFYYNSNSNQPQKIETHSKMKIHFDLKLNGLLIKFDGIPFICLSSKSIECGYSNTKTNNHLEKHIEGDHDGYAQKSGKGCNALIQIREVMFMIGEKIEKDTQWNRQNARLHLKQKLENGGVPDNSFRGFIVSLPQPSDHNTHDANEIIIDPRIVAEMEKIKVDNKTSILKVQCHIRQFVKDLFNNENLPDDNNRRFYPSRHDISVFIDKMIKKHPPGFSDLELINQKINKEWGGEDNSWFFRQPVEGELLIVFQSLHHKYLLQKYGDYTCHLCPIFKPGKQCYPLYLLFVKTNVGFFDAGFFILGINNTEDKKSVEEALTILKSWNPDWQPASFAITDLEAHHPIIRAVFPDTFVYMCDHHKKQSWRKWAKNIKGECVRGTVTALTKISESMTKEEFQSEALSIMTSEHPNLKSYLETILLREEFVQSWVLAFWPQGVVGMVNVDNTIKSLTQNVRDGYLCGHRDLLSVLTNLVETFLSQQWKKYVKANFIMRKSWSDANLLGLRDKPYILVRHVLGAVRRSRQDITKKMITTDSSGSFRVESSDGKIHTVSIYDKLLCSCQSFRNNAFPCEHIIGVYNWKMNGFSWIKLPPKYRDHPLLNMDEACTQELMTEAEQACNPRFVGILPDPNVPETSFEIDNSDLCRQLAQEIIDETYLLGKDEVSDDILVDIKNILTRMKSKRNKNSLDNSEDQTMSQESGITKNGHVSLPSGTPKKRRKI